MARHFQLFLVDQNVGLIYEVSVITYQDHLRYLLRVYDSGNLLTHYT